MSRLAVESARVSENPHGVLDVSLQNRNVGRPRLLPPTVNIVQDHGE